MYGRLNWGALGLCVTLAFPLQVVKGNECGSCGASDLCSVCAPCDPCQCDPCQSNICGDACGCCEGWGLGNILRPSDHCFDDFISPMSNFVYFEDPRTLTEARAIYFHHNLPDSIGNLNLPGG